MKDSLTSNSKTCSCELWKVNIERISAPIILQQIRTGTSFECDQFDFCPWCGKRLGDETTTADEFYYQGYNDGLIRQENPPSQRPSAKASSFQMKMTPQPARCTCTSWNLGHSDGCPAIGEEPQCEPFDLPAGRHDFTVGNQCGRCGAVKASERPLHEQYPVQGGDILPPPKPAKWRPEKTNELLSELDLQTMDDVRDASLTHPRKPSQPLKIHQPGCPALEPACANCNCDGENEEAR